MPNVEIEMTNHQRAELRFRTVANILSAGGRGSGKSRNLVHALLAHCADFGEQARPVVFREERNALLQLMSVIYEMSAKVFGAVSRNLNDGTITLPNGAVILLSNIADDATYARLQGMGFSGIFGDEVGNYHPNAFVFMQRVRSNLRVPPGRRPEIHLTANPHGRSHGILFKNYISKAPPWHPFPDEHGDTWVWTHSTCDSNHFIDRDAYKLQLAASTGSDSALANAWIQGTWGSLGGGMFEIFDPKVHVLSRVPHCGFTYRLGGDWGTSAPAVCLLLGEVPPATHGYAPGSVIVLDEVDTVADPRDLSLGNGAPPDAFAEQVVEMCNRHGVKHKSGAMDDARGLAADTVIGYMGKHYIYMHKPHTKERVGGWVRIRQMLANAKSGDGPGLYISNRCPHLIETIAEAPRGQLRPEEIDHRWAKDHWLDALRYGLTEFSHGKVGFGRAVGLT
jgi:hypothetical protein